MIIIQTTIDEDKKAKDLINLLLETNKIACGTFNKIQSSYIWKEELIEETLDYYIRKNVEYEKSNIF